MDEVCTLSGSREFLVGLNLIIISNKSKRGTAWDSVPLKTAHWTHICRPLCHIHYIYPWILNSRDPSGHFWDNILTL